MQIVLTVIEGPHQGATFAFTEHDRFFVGRSKRAQFRLRHKDKFLSRLHFLVEVNPPLCRLLDMGSNNGTLVNGQRVQLVDLKDGDLIKAGRSTIRVAVQEEPPPQVEFELEEVPKSSGSLVPVCLTPPRGTSTVAAVCQVCAASFEGAVPTASAAGAPWPVCLKCQERASQRPQPIAGYLLVRELGRGGTGTVDLALRLGDGTLAALKRIVPAVAGWRPDIERFLREASLLRELDHPHIVGFRDVGESNGQLYFAMEYVDGRDAAYLLDREGRFPVRRAVALVCQLLAALAYAHGKGLVHRDIKPANILVTKTADRELVKLADFGLARLYQTSKLSGLTMADETLGTIAFMAPEQITNFRGVQPAADQYAAAATLYQLLTNHFPFDLPRNAHQQILMVLESDPVPLRARRPDLPRELAEVVHRALAKEPLDRFADVRAFWRELVPFAR